MVKSIHDIEQERYETSAKATRVFIVDSNGNEININSDYLTNDLDDYSETNITYVGQEKKDGTWLILKIDENTGTVIRGASQKNNSSYSSYSNAWTNRTSLTYTYLKDVL